MLLASHPKATSPSPAPVSVLGFAFHFHGETLQRKGAEILVHNRYCFIELIPRQGGGWDSESRVEDTNPQEFSPFHLSVGGNADMSVHSQLLWNSHCITLVENSLLEELTRVRDIHCTEAGKILDTGVPQGGWLPKMSYLALGILLQLCVVKKCPPWGIFLNGPYLMCPSPLRKWLKWCMLSAFEHKGLAHGRYMLDSHYSYWKMKRLVFILFFLEGEGR